MKTSTSPHYYHCASKGFDHCVLFADVREFIAGMNRIGICLARLQQEAPVLVIAFCLMDNHVHFILYGTREHCFKWMALYHRLTMIWQKHHRDGAPVDEPWEYDAWQIIDSEDLKEKIAYVLRNPTVARMGFVPGGYRWSSASLMFSDVSGQKANGRLIGTLSTYESRNLFGTRLILPEDWIVMPDGMIWPGCYTDYQRAERLFSHPRSYLFSLNQNVETAINQQMYQETISLPDQDVYQMAKALSTELFGKADVALLDLESRIQLTRQLKKKSGSSLKQLARIVHIPLKDLKTIFQ